MEDLDELIRDDPARKARRCHGTDHGIALLSRVYNGHAEGLRSVAGGRKPGACGFPPPLDIGYKLGNSAGIGIPFRLFHDDARHGDAARRAEISGGLVGLVESHETAGANEVLVVVGVEVVLFVDVLTQLCIQSANPLLQLDDIISTDLLSPGGIVVFACRARPFARETSRERGITSGFPLDRSS